MTRSMRAARRAAAAGALALLSGAALLPPPAIGPAVAQTFDAGPSDGRGDTDSLSNRVTVSIRVVPVGSICVRAVEAVGYDPRLNQRLYRIGFDSGPMTSLGINAYENAFSSARTQADAVAALAAAQADARSFRRAPGQC